MYENLPVISVADYNSFVNEMISQVKFAVRGEISGYRVSQGKWVTFELKDNSSRVACFTTVYKQPNQLEDGMEVICYGFPRIYVPYGKYSFNVDLVSPVGEGALKKAFELTKKLLEKEGLFDVQYKKIIPKFPQTIGLITSSGAAAYTDVLRILKNRWAGLEIFLKPVLVQGVKAPAEIVAALEYFNKQFPVDVIILTRGGGSLEDLQAFNSENVCRSVFASKIPVIAGVGHERDISLVDYTADLRASTPSNAAEMAVPDKVDFLSDLNFKQHRVGEIISNYLWQIKQGFDRYLDKSIVFLEKARAGFELVRTKFESQGADFGRVLDFKKKSLDYKEMFLKNLSPMAILKKGYCISYDAKSGKVLKSVSKLKWGDRIKTRFSDGQITSLVEKKIEIKNK